MTLLNIFSCISYLGVNNQEDSPMILTPEVRLADMNGLIVNDTRGYLSTPSTKFHWRDEFDVKRT